MSSKQVTKQVERTYTEVTCDKCNLEITGDDLHMWCEFLPNGVDMHNECYKQVIKDSFSKYEQKVGS